MNLSSDHIQSAILRAIENANQAREADDQISLHPDAVLYGKESKLDSLGLVGLLIDIEDELRDAECEVSLSDERAMSQSRSPFRSVATLVEYIEGLVGSQTC